METTCAGKLVINEDYNDLVYEIHNSNGWVFHLSKALDYIYKSLKSNHISLQIYGKGKLLFNENSNLYKNKNKLLGDSKYSYTYFIEGNGNLENVLFDNTGETIDLTLSADAIGDNYEQFYSRKS